MNGMKHMRSYQQPETDLHIHTVASGHAYSTITEIASAARMKGLKGVAITDHGPALPGGPHFYHFAAMRFIPEYLEGVRIWRGVESNIIGYGEIDLSPKHCNNLDLVMAGFHDGCGFEGRGLEANTRAMMEVMELPWVRIITHPGNPKYPVDYGQIVAQAVATGTALEINNSSFTLSRKGSEGNCRSIASLCAEKGARVSIGSDAHIACRVGEFDEALGAIADAEFPEELIINRTLASTEAFLAERPRA